MAVSSSLRCDLQVIGAKNIEIKHKGNLFIRCYISAGNNKRIQLNTREIIMSSKKHDYIFWDDSFSLECNGEETSVNNLKEEKMVFELRLRSSKTNFLGKNGSSQLVARGEVPWKSVFEAPNMEIQRWVGLIISEKMCGDDCMKAPALEVMIRVEVPVVSKAVSTEEMRRRRRRERLKNCGECGCSSCGGFCSCADNELLFVAAALDVF